MFELVLACMCEYGALVVVEWFERRAVEQLAELSLEELFARAEEVCSRY